MTKLSNEDVKKMHEMKKENYAKYKVALDDVVVAEMALSRANRKAKKARHQYSAEFIAKEFGVSTIHARQILAGTRRMNFENKLP